MNLKIIFKRLILLDLSLMVLIFISAFFESEIVVAFNEGINMSLIHISDPTRRKSLSRMPTTA